jgi:hypothetical protein
MTAIPPCNLRTILLVTAVAAVQLLAACAAAPSLVDHSFSFDAIWDSPGITILDYRYGSSDFPGAANVEERRKKGESAQRTGTTGPMPAGPDLYVKWRVDATGEMFERTVDLRKKLSGDIDGHTVYFVVQGSALHVYLVTPEPRDPKSAPVGPEKFHHRKVIVLYPDR